MKKIFLTLSFLVLISFSYAQKTIAVLSGTTWTFYDDFSPALRGAPAGSTIYVPGRTFDLGGNDTINKPLTIIGTGFSVDSTAATLSTVLIGSLYYSTGANYTTLIGLDIAGAINSISGIVYNNTIDRCRIRSSVTLYNTVTSKFLNILIKESVIEDDLNASSSDVINLTVEKCILFKEMSLQIGAVIKNNYFVNNFCSGCSRSNTFRFVDNSFFENNVIITSYSSPFTASDNNTIKIIYL
ncbi:MAG: hypothetical protein IPP60_08800 [Sphingobacteriales bacterium]|nr:hypothetical protein [Sphingobacteriales bacterium]